MVRGICEKDEHLEKELVALGDFVCLVEYLLNTYEALDFLFRNQLIKTGYGVLSVIPGHE